MFAIDFEASCLPRHGRSFPIEVGLAGVDGARSWLIQPHPDWTGWDWTAEAEALHGLSLARIERDGLPAHVVLDQLADAVGGRRVVADSLIDPYWLDTLAAAAGRAAPFAIDHVATLMDERQVDEAQISAAVRLADQRCPTRHRAGSDALWLASVMALLWPDVAGSRSARMPLMSR
ncbi:hypothetical protein EBBID32_34050 [Sphingobium indicum BiD32]|uniref:Exonuclease domain-containing protein n=1 Tax=Sphingobium indicum BiD32 TaxID=1301087 RepID=N1MQL6_9SPHN|nr:hypothetical protein [Sphingobium indicum]CCW19044.1 hypothetical protein EBBID32_34050 [Sphingobium indicum BiD32]